ncbi:transglutaminaseTgpA domain-containing protein [Cupriavidus plantarum]|uniref:transglutaminase family protein n=1 Tax=Cupriavidus plantarum TaxID=942865 RepID=UPI001B0A7BB1|nr:DUF3488 and transglutaminase-like domain-containing protein [Cupriavidus plantarum]CAG2154238.1 Protein-glutamine gamma-glutamyltransferase [Cupriavidus plantarum]SMR86833.1 protein of unknown function [Cupriavidus plantarum]
MTAARLRPLAHQEHGMLMGQLALVLAPQARTLPVSVSLLLVVLMAWRWLLWRQRAPLPSRTMLAVVAMLVLATSAALVWQAGGSLGRDLCVALLGAFVILKLLECRALSDATIVTQLSFYLLLTLYLTDQPFWLALYSMAIGAWVLRNWLLLHHPEARGRLAIWPLLGRMALIGLPWALFLFVLFPRLDHPLWRLPQSESTGKTGITDTMRPGSIGELIRSTEVAFRADMSGDPLPPSALYWRALILWHYDGQQWRTLEQQRLVRAAPVLRDDASDVATPAPAGMRDYSVTLEASQQSWLYLLDRGIALSGMPEARMSYDGEFFARAPIDRAVRYRARSTFEHGAASSATLPPRIRALALELPPGNPRSRALAARWAETVADPWQRVQAALRVFAGEAFYYTLSPPPLGSQQVDSFVFDTHRGFCEHYASSFVFLMRAAGVPARVVTGYQGGEYNTIGRHYIVRQSDAHAWAEVWIDGRGWVRVDPTSAVAPSRVEEGVDAALAGDEADAVRALRTPGWLRDLRWSFDGLMYTWQRWILDYDRDRQMALLRQFGMDDRLPQILMMGLASLTLIGLVPLWLRRQRLDPLQAMYARFCRELAKRGYERGAAEGPQAFAQRAAAAMPQAAPALHAFTAEYVRLRYGAPPAAGPGSLAALHRALCEVILSIRQR